MKFYVHTELAFKYRTFRDSDQSIGIRRLNDDGSIHYWNYIESKNSSTWLLCQDKTMPPTERLVGIFDTFDEALTHCLGVPSLNKFASRFV